MKRQCRQTISVIAALALSPFSAAPAEDRPFWYEVTIMHGAAPYEFYGSSELAPVRFIEAVAGQPFIRLDDLVFRQKVKGATKYSPWKEWDPLKTPSIYLSTSYIIAVHPLRGDPQVTQDGD